MKKLFALLVIALSAIGASGQGVYKIAEGDQIKGGQEITSVPNIKMTFGNDTYNSGKKIIYLIILLMSQERMLLKTLMKLFLRMVMFLQQEHSINLSQVLTEYWNLHSLLTRKRYLLLARMALSYKTFL